MSNTFEPTSVVRCLQCGHNNHVFADGHCVCGCPSLVIQWAEGSAPDEEGAPPAEDPTPVPIDDPPAEAPDEKKNELPPVEEIEETAALSA